MNPSGQDSGFAFHQGNARGQEWGARWAGDCLTQQLLPCLQHLAFGTLHKRHTRTCPFILSARPTDLCPLSMESPVWLTVLSGSLWSRCEPHVSTRVGFEGGIPDRGWEGRMQRGHRGLTSNYTLDIPNSLPWLSGQEDALPLNFSSGWSGRVRRYSSGQWPRLVIGFWEATLPLHKGNELENTD